MGRYSFDGKNFNSQTDAKNHVRNLLKSVGICKSVKKKDKEVFKRLAKYLSRHNDAIKKGVTDHYGNIIIQDIEIQHNIKKDLDVKIIK